MPRARVVAGLLLATALVLAGAACSDDDGPGSATSVTPPTTLAPSTTAAVTSTTSASGPTSGPTTSPGTTSAPGSTTPSGPDLAAARVRLEPVAELEDAVVMAVRPGDPARYVGTQTGEVWVLRDGTPEPELVVDLSALTRAQGERGFLGMAFAPDGQHLYVSYTDPVGDSHVDELTVGADGAIDPARRRQVLFQEQPYANHNGGNIVFGPDGYLYIGFGDGGSGGDPERRAMRLDTWLGKLLRIDPRAAGAEPYTVPPDNPFVGQAGARPEIWSLGLRNPWRFSFDALTGDLWIGDVGQGEIEEIDVAPAAAGGGRGVSFGWSAFEGTERYNEDQPAEGAVGPVHEYRHGDDLGGCSVTGGYVYRGTAIPALQGAYLFADFCVGGVRAISPAAPAEVVELTPDPGSIASFGEGPDRELYVLTLDGGVFAIRPA